MLIWLYTCQNATLLEITCRGSYVAHKSAVDSQQIYDIACKN